MAKRNSKKWKKSSFYEEKSLVGWTPEFIINEILEMKFVLSAKTSVTFLSVFLGRHATDNLGPVSSSLLGHLFSFKKRLRGTTG
jgi:hypothetical protein